jgi:hypothetical protein
MPQLVAHPAVAGVVLACAGIITITPTSVPLPGVQVAAVQLSSSFDPITPWEDVLTTASANATALFAEWSAAPFPVLQQTVVNQVGYLGELPDLQTIDGQISDHLQAAGHAAVAPDLGLLNTAHLEALNGDIAGGVIPANLLSPELFQSPILSAASGVLVGALGPVVSPVLALDNSIQEITTALTGPNPDFITALNDLVNIPAAVTGAFLDGYGSVDLTPWLSDLSVSSLLPTGSTLNSLDVAMGGRAAHCSTRSASTCRSAHPFPLNLWAASSWPVARSAPSVPSSTCRRPSPRRSAGAASGIRSTC